MKKILTVSLCLVLTVSLAASLAIAKTQEDGRKTDYRPHRPLPMSVQGDVGLGQYQAAAVQGTTDLAFYTWDSGPNCVDEGWTSTDATFQPVNYWHVDNFVGAGTTNTGVINGTKSMWCGKRADTAIPYCGFKTLPGYANNWNQNFCTKECKSYGDNIEVTFAADWDSEQNWDYTSLQINICDADGPRGANSSEAGWTNIAGGSGVWDGNLDDFLVTGGDTVLTVSITDSIYVNSSVAFRFHFTSDGAWSDEDGQQNTDGAFIVDDLQIKGDLDSLALEDFEDEGQDAGSSNDWEGCNPIGYGDFAGIFNALTLLQEDDCFTNLSCVWGFFNGSEADYSCGLHPEQTAVPFVNERAQYINNRIVSPFIPLSGTGTQFEMQWDTYRDLPLPYLIFYTWGVRTRGIATDPNCPQYWDGDGFVYYGPEKDWIRSVFTIGDFVDAINGNAIQIYIGCRDMCPYWCGVYGPGTCHSHAPLFDNFYVYRIAAEGPIWNVTDIRLFQDNFADDGTTTGTARIDMALDRMDSENFNHVRPGDSSLVKVTDPEQGLAEDPTYGGPAIYAYVSVDGPTAAAVTADPTILSDDASRWPYVTSTTDGYGRTWHAVRFDTAFSYPGANIARVDPVPDRFCVDLADTLFVPGDTIYYVYCAESANTGTRTYWTGGIGGQVSTFDEAAVTPDEVTILPAGGFNRGGDILYVDGMNFRGAQPYFDSAFLQLGLLDKIDRYDIRGPSSQVANRPGHRVKNEFQQLIPIYKKIVWNTGNLDDGLIGDGTGQPEKSDDGRILYNFLDQRTTPGGIYFNGDNIAEEWPNLAGNAASIKSVYIQHSLADGDHVNAGFEINPRVIGESGGCFDHATGPDTLIAYGGCPIINNFDVMNAVTNVSTQEMRYDGVAASDGAVIAQYTLNSDSVQVGVVLSGFSFHYIRDDRAGTGLDRAHHMQDILLWLGNDVPDPTPATPTFQNSLSQNYPNPFNPTTTIDFTVKELAPVTVKIYNVRGQLVKTLANDRFEPGVTHQLTWDGRNNAGQSVSSGVYFYKLVTKSFTQTKKMVLLK
jgi:hypothetical protein